MLQVSSSFSKKSEQFYFLELYGETSPKVDPDYARVLATRGQSNAGPIYEYFWTLGHCRPPQQEEKEEQQEGEDNLGRDLKHLLSWIGKAKNGEWGKFDADSFVHVCVLFPKSSGWRVHELAASVKYLTPVSEQKSFLQEMDKEFAELQPLLGVAGTTASAVGAMGAGPAASATGHVLDAMAKMKVGSVPQAPGFEWWVKKFTTWVAQETSDTRSASNTDTAENSTSKTETGELVDGVVWSIPPSMLETLGSRINGSVAVSLLPLSNQKSPSSDLQPGIVRACATLPLYSGTISLPADKYVCLQVRPQHS